MQTEHLIKEGFSNVTTKKCNSGETCLLKETWQIFFSKALQHEREGLIVNVGKFKLGINHTDSSRESDNLLKCINKNSFFNWLKSILL